VVDTAGIDATVRALLAERLRLAEAPLDGPLDPDESLVELGIDSTGIMSLVVAIEEAFDIEVSDHDITTANFGTLAGIVRYVAGRVGA
jgi:acyl carrier protein